ncbi:MAG: glycosyltransferase [Nanoarchaeota archaeon]|nr:glycosyltransferase [Nanoarchaeota archaeon]
MSKLSILIPIHNEEQILRQNVIMLRNFLKSNLKHAFRIILVTGQESRDSSPKIAKDLSEEFDDIINSDIIANGKAEKIINATMAYDSDFYAFIDADLPVELGEFLKIVQAVIYNKADIAIGSRYMGTKSSRPLMRKIASRTYNSLLRLTLNIKTNDACAGAKSWNSLSNNLFKQIKIKTWFFDTELLYRAFKKRLRVVQVPITYTDTRADSNINVFREGRHMGICLFKLWLNDIFGRTK